MSTLRSPNGRKSRLTGVESGTPSCAPATVPSPNSLPDLLTADEVASWLKTTVQAVYAKAERGTLPGATRVGRRLYFLRTELLRLVEQGRVPHLGGPGGGT